jgi:hypothetical protein
MNAFLLALASAGALLVMATTDPGEVIPTGEELGSMTRAFSTNPDTGAIEETSIIAFLD